MVETSDSVSKALTLWAVVASAVLGGAILVLMSQAPIWGWLVIVVFVLLTFTALLSFSDSASRAFLAGTLRKSNYTQIYTTLTRRAVMRIWDALCDPAENRDSPATLLRAALTWRLYDRALMIAVVYPILLLVGQWVVTGSDGFWGGPSVLERQDKWWDSALAIVFFASIICGVASALVFLVNWRNEGWRRISWRTLRSHLSGAIFFAVSGLTAVMALLGAHGGVLFATLAFTFALANVIEWLQRNDKSRSGQILLTFASCAAIITSIAWIDVFHLPKDAILLFFFLGVFPLLNAVFDTASYAVTLTLIRRGLRSRLPVLWGLADLVIAFGLFLALGAALVGTIHGLNALSGTMLLDLPALLRAAQDDPGAHLWLYLMLFSTIVPTALHAGLSLLGVQGLWPRAWRRPVALWVEQANASPLATLRAALALGVIWTLPLVVMGGIVWALWQIAGGVITTGLGHYFNALMWLAT